ncbi:hypothetical protein BGX26_006355 [Mortierella sp. AD094]|nr:hypothetical protein BGX26_006355 [Mortierella sp. AD094]
MSAMENGRATHGPSKKEKNKTDNRSSGRSRKPVEIEQVDGATLHGSLVAEAKYDLEYDSSLDKAMSDVRYGERSIVGNFTCKYCRPSHPRTWASGVISTELWLARNSNLNRYRAMLHSQKCKRCNRYAEPEVDIDNYVRKAMIKAVIIFFITVQITMDLAGSSPHELFTDATLKQGAWINDDGVTSVFSVPEEYRHSSFESEYYSVHRAILENGIPNMQINLHCDHRGLCKTLERRAMRHPVKHAHLNVLFKALMSFMESNNIQLKVSWIPSELNPADELSRSESEVLDWVDWTV